jgi:hypothetical protein
LLLSRGRNVKSKMALSNFIRLSPLSLVLGGLNLLTSGHDHP